MTVPPPIGRRRLLQGFAAFAAATPVAAGATEGAAGIRDIPSLGVTAARRGLLFGSAIDIATLDDPVASVLYLHHARIFTADNSLKFGALRPQEGPADFAAADRLVAFAQSHAVPLRGHCLVWNEWNPPWVGKLSASRRAYWLDRHIDEVVGRYAGRIAIWDVVNEPFWPGHGNPGGFRGGPWYDALGPAYVQRALRRARAADPTGRIAINEAGPEWEQVWGPSQPYRDGLLRLVDDAQASGVGLDQVGLQCHWFPEFTFDRGRFRAYLAELARRGVAIALTEIDVNDARFPGDEAARDAAVAGRYRQLLEAALAEPKVESISTWQLADNASWLMAEPKLWGAPGRRPRPLPFDASYAPKAAYFAIAGALGSPW